MKRRKEKKKRTKKQLVARLIIYIVAAAALSTGFYFYMRYEQEEAELEWKRQTCASLAGPALHESEEEIRMIVEEEKKLSAAGVELTLDENDVIWELGDITHCFANVRALTGTEDFEPIGGYEIKEESRKALEEVMQILESRGYTIGFIVMDIRTGKGVAYNCDHEYFSASSVKGPYMVSLIANEPESLEDYRYYFDGIAATSDNGCYNNLFYIYGNEYFNSWCEGAGIDLRMDSDYNYVWYTPRMLASLWLMNYQFFITDEENGENAAALFDHPSYSTIHTSLYPMYKTLTKSGWIDLRYKSMVDSGIILDGENTFLITLMTDYGGDLLELNGITFELEKIHADIAGENSKLTDYYIEKLKKQYPIGYWWG